VDASLKYAYKILIAPFSGGANNTDVHCTVKQRIDKLNAEACLSSLLCYSEAGIPISSGSTEVELRFCPWIICSNIELGGLTYGLHYVPIMCMHRWAQPKVSLR
jgi:hypothetical protein